MNFNDDDNTNGTGGKDDKKNKAKKRVNTKKEGGPAQMKGGADRGNPNLNHGADKSRASYASEHVNGGKFEETKNKATRQNKGDQPASGGGNKKRLKSKKLTTSKQDSLNQEISITGQQQ